MPRVLKQPIRAITATIRLRGFEAADTGEDESRNPFAVGSNAGRTWERARLMRLRWLRRMEVTL